MRSLLHAQLHDVGVDASTKQSMTVFRPSGEEFEVDDDYTPIFIPGNLQWRWDTSSRTCAARIR